jgi:putative iron-only hydrogenase system regulator
MVLGVLGILLSNRREQAPRVQEVLTKYGDLILCRSGVHDPVKARGLITLTMEAAETEINALTAELHDVSGVEVGIALLPEGQ